jgi:hypothetical protein
VVERICPLYDRTRARHTAEATSVPLRAERTHLDCPDIKEIHQRFHLLQQEVESAISLVEEARLNGAAVADALKIEVEALRRFMEDYDPDFARRYAELRTQVIHEVNPEWMESSSRRQT